MTQTSTIESNYTTQVPHENIMIAFQERAQQITREHVQMLQLIYQKDYSGAERGRLLFEQHYIFLKEELTDLLNKLVRGANSHPEPNINYIRDKLGDTLDRYLNFFKDNCKPTRMPD